MNKFIIAYIFTLFISLKTNSEFTNRVFTDVYVCYSKTSVAYHSIKDCKGLTRCTHKIIEVSETDAIKKHEKRKCKVCY